MGGLYLKSGTLALHNSLTVGNVNGANGVTDFAAAGGTISATFNLFGDADALTTFVANATFQLDSNNIVGQQLAMSALANHGGRTATLLADVASP